jgi:hypothetical protein
MAMVIISKATHDKLRELAFKRKKTQKELVELAIKETYK